MLKHMDSYVHHNALGNIPSVPFSDMHHGVYVISLLAWAWVLSAFWFTFGNQREGAFMVAISSFYFLIFFGIPILMTRTGRKISPALPNRQSFSEFLRSEVGTANGVLTGREALLQITLIPIGLAFCISGIAFAVVSARNAFGS